MQYLLGGHRAFFFDYMDAMGLSRYLPIVVYAKGAPDKAAFFGHRLENFQREVKPFWTPEQNCTSSGSVDVMKKAVEHVKKIGACERVGVEMAFLPMDSAAALKSNLPDAEIVDALFVLERLRAHEVAGGAGDAAVASERVIDSMQAVIAKHGPGIDQAGDRGRAQGRGGQPRADLRVLPDRRRREPQPRAVASSAGRRATCSRSIPAATIHGYIGDLARMAILGEPDAELVDLLAEIEGTQRAAMKPVKAGVMGGEIYAAAEALLAKSKIHNHMHFLAHGMGLVSHEAPRLTATGPVPYDAYDATRPLETGMVVSVETTLMHPKRGFIKLEDTIAVTDTGFDIYGEGARGWNIGGTAPGR